MSGKYFFQYYLHILLFHTDCSTTYLTTRHPQWCCYLHIAPPPTGLQGTHSDVVVVVVVYILLHHLLDYKAPTVMMLLFTDCSISWTTRHPQWCCCCKHRLLHHLLDYKAPTDHSDDVVVVVYRLLHHLLDYKAPTVMLLAFEDHVYMVAADREWK